MMKATWLFFGLMLCLAGLYPASPPSFSPRYSWELSITTQAGPLPAESVLYVQYLGDDGRRYSTLLSLREGGRATLYTNTGISQAEMSYDDEATPSLDAEWNGSLEGAVQPMPVRLQPVGEVAGVLYAQNGSAAANVAVELACSDGTARSALTSVSGAFSFPRVGAGQCIATASVDGQAAREEFSLGMGEFRSLSLRPQKPDIAQYAAAGGLLVVVAALLWMAFRKMGKSPGASGGSRKPKAEKMPTARQSDLLATLDGKERGIMQYVLHHFPAAVRVSRIRRDLLIPKTSLTRTLQALERKKFLRLEKIGSRQFAQLHEFFRGEGAA